MSIVRAIERAYRITAERGWDRVYWALDLHGTCISSNYQKGVYSWLTPECGPILKEISQLPETNLIVWSSLHDSDKIGIATFFKEAGVKIIGINENPLEKSTDTGCFDQKFYMSIIVDDKAGFDPDEWPQVMQAVMDARAKYGWH